MSATIRNQALRPGGACARCRKGKTKCLFENGNPSCRNCHKGGHECYIERGPSQPTAAARPAARPSPVVDSARAVVPVPGRLLPTAIDPIGPEDLLECERVVSKTFPACIVFHKPSFIQQLKAGTLEPVLVFGLLTTAARSSIGLVRRHGANLSKGASEVADLFASKTIAIINDKLNDPCLPNSQPLRLPDIQSLCLLILHEWGNRNAVRAYIYLGQAARMLHMYRVLNPPTMRNDSDQFHQDESLRRTIWLIYVLDCMLTSNPGRRFALNVADYDGLSLPCQDVFFVFGNITYAPTLANLPPRDMPVGATVSEVGEMGFIVIGATIWSDVAHFLMNLRDAPFAEADAVGFMNRIADLRKALPVQYVDKPQQINLHITMGSGFTFAMVHSLMHCTNIFLQRRVMLDHVVPPSAARDAEGNYAPPSMDALEKWSVEYEAWCNSQQCHDIIINLFNSCHAIFGLINALEAQVDKDTSVQFPIYMLFAAFSASVTIAYLLLKGLIPRHLMETAASIVGDGLRFMSQAIGMWPLTLPWHRHLSVMDRIIGHEGSRSSSSYPYYNNNNNNNNAALSNTSPHHAQSVKDESASNPDSHQDAMDYDAASVGIRPGSADVRAHSEGARGGSEPHVPLPRRSGVTTINGTPAGVVAPVAAGSPCHVDPSRVVVVANGNGNTNGSGNGNVGETESSGRVPLPSSGNHGMPPGPIIVPQRPPTPGAPQDMNAAELCAVFERQLLELDDVAAFIGGGV